MTDKNKREVDTGQESQHVMGQLTSQELDEKLL
jgi:hypothetical protein